MLPFLVDDVFTDRPFAGNPLAIVEESDGLTDVQMQTLARQFGLSETIFVQTPEDTAHTAKVRIFTPTHDGIPEDPATGSATAIRAAQILANGSFPTARRSCTSARVSRWAGRAPCV